MSPDSSGSQKIIRPPSARLASTSWTPKRIVQSIIPAFPTKPSPPTSYKVHAAPEPPCFGLVPSLRQAMRFMFTAKELKYLDSYPDADEEEVTWMIAPKRCTVFRRRERVGREGVEQLDEIQPQAFTQGIRHSNMVTWNMSPKEERFPLL